MNKLVFITGGSRGIGEAMVARFYGAGYRVAFSYNTQEKKASSIVDASDGKIFSVQMDQADLNSIKGAVNKVSKHFNTSIDILINNAAIADEKAFQSIQADDWSRMLNINLQGPFSLCQEVLPDMLENSWGRIINITSIGGQWGGFNQVHYAASKAGLISLTQSVAKIYSKNSITSNAIAIGLVATDMTALELDSEAGQDKLKAIPIGRLGTTKEVANVALFLASDDASYLTGQTLNPNGGMYFG